MNIFLVYPTHNPFASKVFFTRKKAYRYISRKYNNLFDLPYQFFLNELVKGFVEFGFYEQHSEKKTTIIVSRERLIF